MSDFATMCWPSMKSVVPPAVAWRNVPPRLIWVEANAASVSGPSVPAVITIPSAAARRRTSSRVMPRSISRLSASSAVFIRASSGLLSPAYWVGAIQLLSHPESKRRFRRRVGSVADWSGIVVPDARATRPVRPRADDRRGEGAPRPRQRRQAELEREPLRTVAGSSRRDPRRARKHLALSRAALHRLQERGRGRYRHEPDEHPPGARQPRAARAHCQPALATGRPRRRARADVRPLRADLVHARCSGASRADARSRDRSRSAGRDRPRGRCPHRLGLRPQQSHWLRARFLRVEGLPRRVCRTGVLPSSTRPTPTSSLPSAASAASSTSQRGVA